jgi:hypothetical protein
MGQAKTKKQNREAFGGIYMRALRVFVNLLLYLLAPIWVIILAPISMYQDIRRGKRWETLDKRLFLFLIPIVGGVVLQYFMIFDRTFGLLAGDATIVAVVKGEQFLWE